MQAEIKETRTKCYTCSRPTSTCICKYIHPISTKTRFVILMHPKEHKREKIGTGRMTHLQLENSEIIVGVDFTNNERVNEIIANEKNNALLLYPGLDSFNLSMRDRADTISFMDETPYLFILDGTWPCARKMLKQSKNLQALKRVSFDNDITSKFVIKQQPAALCLSTIESVYTVVNLLKESDVEHCDTNGFLSPFEKLIDYQLDYMLNPNSRHYRSDAKKEIGPKVMYKKNAGKNILRE